MVTVDTSTITLDELVEKFLTIGQHVDQVLLRNSSPQSLAFVSSASNTDFIVQLDNVNKQLSKLPAALLLSTSDSSNESDGRSGSGRGRDGRGGGRGGGGRGKRKKYCWNCGGDHHILQHTRTILKEKEKRGHTDTYVDESAFFPKVSLRRATCVQICIFTKRRLPSFLAVTLNLTITMLRSRIMLHFLLQC